MALPMRSTWVQPQASLGAVDRAGNELARGEITTEDDLFLLHMLARAKAPDQGGARIAIIVKMLKDMSIGQSG